MILMSKMENNTVNKAGSTGVELNLNDGTQRYQVTKKDLKKTADRYNFMACNIFNYESQMGPAVAWAMAPVLRKIYKKDEEYKEALNNHFNYFNSTTVMSSMILGATLAIEEKDGIEAKETVQSLKTSLMGPFAGMGSLADDHGIYFRIYGTAGKSAGCDHLVYCKHHFLVCKEKNV